MIATKPIAGLQEEKTWTTAFTGAEREAALGIKP
jgi:hypothetical protein